MIINNVNMSRRTLNGYNRNPKTNDTVPLTSQGCKLVSRDGDILILPAKSQILELRIERVDQPQQDTKAIVYLQPLRGKPQTLVEFSTAIQKLNLKRGQFRFPEWQGDQYLCVRTEEEEWDGLINVIIKCKIFF